MKKYIGLIVVVFLFLTSCQSIAVYADYDKNASFQEYKTYSFLAEDIAKVKISGLDKKRILNALHAKLQQKGLTQSDTPDLFITFFPKSNQRVDVWNNNWGWGGGYWGWGGYWGGNWGGNQVSTTTEGILFIDFIDSKTNELIWQGQGTGVLDQNPERKEVLIQEFVDKILNQYPPEIKK